MRWWLIRLIGGPLGFEVSSAVCSNCCVVFGLFMGVWWRGSGVPAMDHCGLGCWIVGGGGVTSGFVTCVFALFGTLELLIRKKRRLLLGLPCRHTLRAGKLPNKTWTNVLHIGEKIFQRWVIRLGGSEMFAGETQTTN